MLMLFKHAYSQLGLNLASMQKCQKLFTFYILNTALSNCNRGLHLGLSWVDFFGEVVPHERKRANTGFTQTTFGGY